MIEKRDEHGSAIMTYLGSHVSKSRIKISITAVKRPCVTRDGCRRRRIRSSLGRPGLGDAARFQHRFGVLSETFSHSVTLCQVELVETAPRRAVRLHQSCSRASALATVSDPTYPTRGLRLALKSPPITKRSVLSLHLASTLPIISSIAACRSGCVA